MQVFNGVQITINNVAGSFVNQSADAWAVTILHELGHAYWDLYGQGTSSIVPDDSSVPNNVKVSGDNSALIEKKCKL